MTKYQQISLISLGRLNTKEKLYLLRRFLKLLIAIRDAASGSEPGQPEVQSAAEDIAALKISAEEIARLEEIIERHNAQPIDGDRWFDTRRHQAVPAACVPDGTPILETLRPGWLLENQVLRRARVRVEPN